MQHHLYGYLRAKADKHGPAGSFYYIGISSGPEDRRRFARHRDGIPVPPKGDPCNVVIARFETEEELRKREEAMVAELGRVGIEANGVLLNRSAGGTFKLDPEWARSVKSTEGEWKSRYSRLVAHAAKCGIKLPPCMKRIPDHWARSICGPANKGKPKVAHRNAFGFWNTLAAQGAHDELYEAAVQRLYLLKALGCRLNRWLSPGQFIQALDDYWDPKDCRRFLYQTAPLIKAAVRLQAR